MANKKYSASGSNIKRELNIPSKNNFEFGRAVLERLYLQYAETSNTCGTEYYK